MTNMAAQNAKILDSIHTEMMATLKLGIDGMSYRELFEATGYAAKRIVTLLSTDDRYEVGTLANQNNVWRFTRAHVVELLSISWDA